MSQEEYLLLNDFLNTRLGLNFPEHKKLILESRLRPRLFELHYQSYKEYFMRLLFVDSELKLFASIITNNETYFFREAAQFHALFKHGMDELKKTSYFKTPIRILSAGCSSGEEPYTLNILSQEYQMKSGTPSTIIDAFDIDVKCVKRTLKADYTQNSFRGITQDHILHYFRNTGSYFNLKEQFRKNVNVRNGNILEFESYQAPDYYDVIFCRNVLIYFTETAILKAIHNFNKSLRPGGFLFLGHSESIIGYPHSLQTLRLGDCIAYKKADE